MICYCSKVTLSFQQQKHKASALSGEPSFLSKLFYIQVRPGDPHRENSVMLTSAVCMRIGPCSYYVTKALKPMSYFSSESSVLVFIPHPPTQA